MKLVDQNMLEAALIVIENLWILKPEFVGAKQNLAKVDHAAAVAGDFVGAIDAQHCLGVIIAKVVDIAGTQAFVFLAIDIPLALLSGPAFVVDLKLAVYSLN